MFKVKVAVVALATLVLGPSAPAVAEPTTPITYNAGTTATRFTGLAFDTCTAPTLAQMTAWRASPYKAIGIYIGGVNRSCAQPRLTAAWVTAVTAMGWRLVPIYLGLQAPCGTRRVQDVDRPPPTGKRCGTRMTRSPRPRRWASCRAVRSTTTWSTTTTRTPSAVPPYCTTCPRGRRSCTCSDTCPASTATRTRVHRTWPPAYNSSSYARPDALWIARWDLNSSLTGWPTVPNTFWAVGQRGKQYRGDHTETYGGVTLNIDNDRFDAPVASVSYSYTVRTTIHSYSGPSTAYPVRSTIAANAERTDRLPDLRPEDRHHDRLEQADRRHLHHRLLHQDTEQARLQRTDPRLQLPVPDDHQRPDPAARPGYVVRDLPGPAAGRVTGVDHLPAPRHQGRHDLGLEPSERRLVRHRLLRRHGEQHDLHRADPPLLTH